MQVLSIMLAPDARSILLNNRSIAPLAPLPLDISAPVSLKYLPSAELYGFDIDGVLEWGPNIDESLYITGMEALHLQYEHAVVGTQERDSWWVTFDVTGVNSYHIQRPKEPPLILGSPPSQRELKWQKEWEEEEELKEKKWQEKQQRKPKINHALTAEEQQLVQFRVKQDPVSQTLRIEEMQLVRRADRVKPAIMKCGRPAIMTTSFNPLEWDSYGQIGSLTHGWNVFWHRTFSFFMGPGLVLIVLTAVVGLGAVVKRHIQGRRERALERCADEEDAGVALLAGEGEVEAEDELKKEGDEEKE